MGIYSGKDIQRGFSDERKVLEYFIEQGHEVKRSTKHQNIFEDTDFFVWQDNQWVAYSVKSVGANFHCFGVETHVEVKDWEDPKKPTHIEDGAFYYCKAKYYIMVHGTKLYRIDKSRLNLKKAESHKWLTWKTKQRQLENQHPHIDARCSLFPLADLLIEKIATLIGELPSETSRKSIQPPIKREDRAAKPLAFKNQII